MARRHSARRTSDTAFWVAQWPLQTGSGCVHYAAPPGECGRCVSERGAVVAAALRKAAHSPGGAVTVATEGVGARRSFQPGGAHQLHSKTYSALKSSGTVNWRSNFHMSSRLYIHGSGEKMAHDRLRESR